ncbi:MAG: hypothetical protein BWY09_02028 [Candidatus Hydrogenedentes bacterium ADurb.Bin179]|nr:MAG: hypothetical protein BWY09_02028 [Candidatus Hydrogenedentes bacterium ADurb.Bin179]
MVHIGVAFQSAAGPVSNEFSPQGLAQPHVITEAFPPGLPDFGICGVGVPAAGLHAVDTQSVGVVEAAQRGNAVRLVGAGIPAHGPPIHQFNAVETCLGGKVEYLPNGIVLLERIRGGHESVQSQPAFPPLLCNGLSDCGFRCCRQARRNTACQK